MSRPRFEVADIIRSAGADFIARNCLWLRWTHIKVLRAIARCRTAALGGHIDNCTSCGHRATISYVTCRNRHCPKGQTGARERWIAARRRELLPTPYAHVVVTLPSPPGCVRSSAKIGLSTPNHPSAGPSTSCNISVAIPTASSSQTIAWSHWRTARLPFAGVTLPTTSGKK
jgi:Transposase zinc-binding domain